MRILSFEFISGSYRHYKCRILKKVQNNDIGLIHIFACLLSIKLFACMHVVSVSFTAIRASFRQDYSSLLAVSMLGCGNYKRLMTFYTFNFRIFKIFLMHLIFSRLVFTDIIPDNQRQQSPVRQLYVLNKNKETID